LRLNLDSYHYSADLLGGFVQEIQSGPHKNDTIVAATGDHNVRSFGIYAEAQRRYLMRQVPFVIWGQDLHCGNQQTLPASHRDMFNTLMPLTGIDGPYVNAGRNLLKPVGSKPDPTNAARAMFFTGEARNAQGMWQLGQKNTFVCTGTDSPTQDCQFNALDDQQERARFGLLDWNVRINLRK
jgi:phosphoglycerol transferase MdoB-like AlkP superfamily enzyme